MATKSKLERAVEQQASNLNPAQKELVMSQFSTYKWNKSRIECIEDSLRVIDSTHLDKEKADMLLGKRDSLVSERNQLSIANSNISAKLFEQLRGYADGEE